MNKSSCLYNYGIKHCINVCLGCKNNYTKHIKKPRIPKNEECCGDSCPNCVWDLYFKELKEYNMKVDKIFSE